MTGVLISIIVPVYKVEKYLDRCVSSLINQTYRNIEIILVDDGSPDNCPKMCDEWAIKDTRIKVFHKENGGLSSARNAGINIAKGELIIFVDSDDYIEYNTCELINQNYQNYHADLIVYSLNYVSDGCKNHIIINLDENKLYNKDFIYKKLIPGYIGVDKIDEYQIQPYAWNKVFKLSVLRKNKIKFDENRKMWEDKPFVVTYLKHSENISFISNGLYNYVNIPGSLSRKIEYSIFDIIVKNYMLYSELFDDYDFKNINIVNYYYKVIKNKILECAQHSSFKKEELKKQLKNENIAYWLKNNNVDTIFDSLIRKYYNNLDIVLIICIFESNYLQLKSRMDYCIKKAKRIPNYLKRNIFK